MAGVSRSVAMKITGHKTESVNRRYAITDRKAIGGGMRKVHQFREERTDERTVLPLRREACLPSFLSLPFGRSWHSCGTIGVVRL